MERHRAVGAMRMGRSDQGRNERHSAGARRRLGLRWLREAGRTGAKQDLENRSSAWCGLEADLAVEMGHDLLRNTQAEPGSAASSVIGRLDLDELLEDALPVILGN